MPKITPEIRAAWGGSLADWCLDYLQAKAAAVSHGVSAAHLDHIESILAGQTPTPDEAYWATVAIRALSRLKRSGYEAAQHQLASAWKLEPA